MKNIFSFFLFIFIIQYGFSQEKFPVYKACDSLQSEATNANCFKQKVKQFVVEHFEIPKVVKDDNFKGNFNIIFSVDKLGNFKVIYVNTPYNEIKQEVVKVFQSLPKIQPALYNNHTIEMQFILPFSIPIESKGNDFPQKLDKDHISLLKKEKPIVNLQEKSLFPEHQSELNIPYTHAEYLQYNYYLDQSATAHTAVKPYLYSEVNKYVNLDALKESFYEHKSSWFGRKLLNEHMGYVRGKDYWFTIDPGIDLEFGQDNQDVKTYNNTRSLHINGAIGKKLSFSTSFYESQGRFAKYVNDYARSIRPAGGNPAIVPGRGIAKDFNNNAFDYPVAEAYLSYTPSSHFNFQFGRGKNFIGDGYRSLFLSDVASPYPFFKMTTQFWRFKYTNFLMWMQDVRPELTVDGAYKQKFMAMHYLDFNVSSKLNLGFFEAVIWDDANNRGIDVNYLNPLIFYNSIEFSTGSRAGNTLLGLSAKYKLKNISFYSQFLLDDFRASEITKNNGWWGNKNALQIGAKYYHAFGINNLFLQAEYNSARPYTYSHDELNYNVGHNNQPIAHPWGANFKEYIAIANYSIDRIYANAKLIVGKKGFDFNDGTDNFSYGGDVFADNDNRVSDYGNVNGQGNKATLFLGEFQTGYLVNPATNLKLFVNFVYRNFKINQNIEGFNTSNSTWISVGLRTNLFNWYFDY
ncbi:MAG: gliding motility protein RemB [Lutibacter sp.]